MGYETVAQFGVATLLPALAAVVLFRAETTTAFGRLSYTVRQIIIGLIFGGIAICGTEFGIPVNGAIMNVRDAAPLVSGLLFGGPSGILAGLIGGVERWFSVMWGRGAFTQVGCSIATIAAGMLAALLRKRMFDGKRPTWPFALVIGLVVEVLHLTLIFFTNFEHVSRAFEVVRACTPVMIPLNGIAVGLATASVNGLARQAEGPAPAGKELSKIIQASMMIVVVAGFVFSNGFTTALQNGLARDDVQTLLTLSIRDAEVEIASGNQMATSTRHVGESGRMVIANANGDVVGTQGTLAQSGLADGLAANEPWQVFQATYYGTPVVAMYDEFGEYRVIAQLPVEEAEYARNVSVLISAYMETIVFAGLFAVIYFLVRDLVVDKIRQVNKSLEQITGGDLDTLVDVRSSVEFASLSDGINQTVDALKQAIAEAAARIDAELAYARTVQQNALPQPIEPDPEGDGFEIYAHMEAAKEVGGDFYDYYSLDEQHLAFLVADVSGKGIPAAMLMMKAKTLIKSLAETWLPVDMVFTRANNQICEGNDAGLFVTAWMGVLDVTTGHLVFANAGHNPPVIRRADGSFAYHKVRPNLVLGGMEGIPYAIHELDLDPGDIIFLYTDGVTEATDASDQLFGEDRLVEVLDRNAMSTMHGMCIALHHEIDEFVGDAPQFDDITMLALKYVGRS